MADTKVRYVLEWFSPKSEVIVGETQLRTMTKKKIRRLFSLPEDDFAMSTYTVTVEQRQKLIESFGVRINLNKYAYYVSCYEVKSGGKERPLTYREDEDGVWFT